MLELTIAALGDLLSNACLCSLASLARVRVRVCVATADKDEVVCEEEDGFISYHKDKKDCTHYYMCEGKRKHHMPCPQNLVFNLKESVCDWPENVDGCEAHIVSTSTTAPAP